MSIITCILQEQLARPRRYLPTLYTVTVDAGVARCVTGMLITHSVSYAAEPDPGDMWVIAVKDELRHVLDGFVKECEACRHPKGA